MNIINQRMKKVVLATMLAFTMLILNFQPVMAQENVEDDVTTEYLEKKVSGLEVYELVDEDGNMVGYFEPYSESNPMPAGLKSRYSANFSSWAISAGNYKYGPNQFALSAGHKIEISISQNVTGTSYFGLYNRNTSSFIHFTNVSFTNGISGTVVLGSGVSSSIYSIGIKNSSSKSITYSGSYTL